MPGAASGHLLSLYFLGGKAAWVEGQTPFVVRQGSPAAGAQTHEAAPSQSASARTRRSPT